VNDVKAHPHAKRTEHQLSKVLGALSVLSNIATSSREHKVLLVDAGVPALLPSCLELDHGHETLTQEVRAPSLLLASMHFTPGNLATVDVSHARLIQEEGARGKRAVSIVMFTFERG
jgi:hypothetical protein